MKLPATLRPDALALLAPGLRAVDTEGLAAAGWRPVAAPGDNVDLSPWRRAYAATRWSAEADAPAAGWCCALDPVRLAADMRDVRLADWPLETLDAGTGARLVSAARALLADDSDPRLRRLQLVAPSPGRWYLVGDADDALDFEAAPADALVGHALRHHKPAGADGPLVQRLTTELQMLFHAEGTGVSGVWPCGAGRLPGATVRSLPTLVSDDPFWRGCWRAAAPDAAVRSLPSDGVPVTGAVTAPAPVAAREALAAAARERGLKRLHVVTYEGTSSFARGGWRSLFTRRRP